MLGKARRGSLIPKGEKLGVRVKETRGSIRKVLCGCKRPGEVSRNFRVGVRDPGSHPEFLCACKRPEENSEIFV